ncbi:DUF4190 domain-containing protein [Rothia sp. LK2588]|uniref:DUF4190 domain-containing protein n=1 Tax=Rothia sp. LK2588 TaxID=3114369 RepID=UPI0034CE0246
MASHGSYPAPQPRDNDPQNGSWSNTNGASQGGSDNYVYNPNSTYQQGQPANGQNPYAQQSFGQPSPYNGYNQGYPGAPAPQAPGRGLAIASLVLGILAILGGLFALGLILGIIGLILGIVSLLKAKKRPGSPKGMAITGIILSALGTLLGILGLIFWIFVFNLGMDGFRECGHLVDNQTEYQQCVEGWANQNV